jgi:hypothetical protein
VRERKTPRTMRTYVTLDGEDGTAVFKSRGRRKT